MRVAGFLEHEFCLFSFYRHPDKNKDPDAPKMMAKINHAYEVSSLILHKRLKQKPFPDLELPAF